MTDFQSYNVEMVEVTGGRFWKPYKDIDAILKQAGISPAIRVESARRHESGPVSISAADRSEQRPFA